MSDKPLVARPTPHARANFESHVDQYRKALEMDPDVAHQRHGFVYYHSLRPNERLILARKQGFMRGDAIDEYNLATMAAEEEKWEEAKGHLEKALKLKPDFFEATYQLAVIHEAMGNVPKAKQIAQKALDLAPEADLAFVEEQIRTIGQEDNDSEE